MHTRAKIQLFLKSNNRTFLWLSSLAYPIHILIVPTIDRVAKHTTGWYIVLCQDFLNEAFLRQLCIPYSQLVTKTISGSMKGSVVKELVSSWLELEEPVYQTITDGNSSYP